MGGNRKGIGCGEGISVTGGIKISCSLWLGVSLCIPFLKNFLFVCIFLWEEPVYVASFSQGMRLLHNSGKWPWENILEKNVPSPSLRGLKYLKRVWASIGAPIYDPGQTLFCSVLTHVYSLVVVVCAGGDPKMKECRSQDRVSKTGLVLGPLSGRGELRLTLRSGIVGSPGSPSPLLAL